MKTKFIASLVAALVVLTLFSADGSAVGLGKTCNTVSCDKGLFCEMKPGTCFISDLPGTCARIPKDCPQATGPRLVVCGCNGQTYSNDCARQQAGISLAHKGKCE
jgi:Kazal-type serine protease inhibitor-like protein